MNISESNGTSRPNALDTVFEVLADDSRRRLLVAVLEEDPDDTVPVPEAAHARGMDLERLRSQLWHCHLPRLEETGYVRWDREQGEIARGPNFEEIRPVLELLRDGADELPGELAAATHS